jgi:acetate kinase
MMSESILVVNAGSSSLKFQIFQIGTDRTLTRRVKGAVDGIATRPRLAVKDAAGATLFDEEHPASEVRDLPSALALAQNRLRQQFAGEAPVAVGHRVVHGGPEYSAPTRIDDAVLAYLERLTPLAPLHQPNNLAPIKALHARSPELPQVACFDTAFHRGHPELADRFAIPEALYAEGVRRYGFHGLSYEYIASRLPAAAPEIADRRVIVAHLGSGASMCALKGGRSVESTMGFTALDGLPMGTRPGQIDPGVVLYLMSTKAMTAGEVQDFLYRDCGLKGLSGVSNDMRELLASRDPRAEFAVDYFAYRVGLHAGMLAAALQGIDAFVFTAGIGENSDGIRARIIERLGWLGLALDPAENRRHGLRISRAGSKPVYVVPTDEEVMIAQHTLSLLWSRPPFVAARERLS